MLEEAGRLLMIQKMETPAAYKTLSREAGTVVTDFGHGLIPGYLYFGDHDLSLRPRPNGPLNLPHTFSSRPNSSQAHIKNVTHSGEVDAGENNGLSAPMETDTSQSKRSEDFNFRNNSPRTSTFVEAKVQRRATVNYPDGITTN